MVALKTTNIPEKIRVELTSINKSLNALKWIMNGEKAKASYEEIIPVPMLINKRLGKIIYLNNQSTSAISQKQYDGYQIIKKEIKSIINQLKEIKQQAQEIENTLEQQNAPWTSGRILEFKE